MRCLFIITIRARCRFKYWLHINCDLLQLCDKTNYPTLISLIGNMAMVPSFLFYGPAPFFNVTTSTALIQGMSGLGGFGYAFLIVSTFSRAESEVLKREFPDDIETYLMISGICKITKG